MRKFYTASAFAAALILGLGSAYATTGEFKDMCAWGLANHKDVKTNCSVNATIGGKTYCFSSEDAKTNFMKDSTGNLTKAEAFFKTHKG